MQKGWNREEGEVKKEEQDDEKEENKGRKTKMKTS
jgi:hypothetical protein